jgi:hypothetical protein
VTLKSEIQFQMWLDVLDISEKNGFIVKSEKDGISTKTSGVYKDEKICGRAMVVSTPPKNRESSIYAMSAHAGLIAAKEAARKNADSFENFAEGEWTGADDCLFYFGNGDFVSLVNKNFEKWREKSPLYFQLSGEADKLKKKNAVTAEDYHAWEKEFRRLSDSFSNISGYRDSRELSVECASFVAGKKEEILQKLLKKFDKMGKSKGTTSKYFGGMVEAYTKISQEFTAIVPHSCAAEYVTRCEELIGEYSKKETEAIYAESNARLKELQALEKKSSHAPQELMKLIADYEALHARFEKIKSHADATAKISFCAGEIGKLKAFWTTAAYNEAAEDFRELNDEPETQKFFELTRRARTYKRLAAKFGETAPYEDSTDLKKKCRKNYKAYRFKIFKKVFPFALIFIAIIAVIILISALFNRNEGSENNEHSGITTEFYSELFTHAV